MQGFSLKIRNIRFSFAGSDSIVQPIFRLAFRVAHTKHHVIPWHGLVIRIRRSHRRGPGSIPGVGIV